MEWAEYVAAKIKDGNQETLASRTGLSQSTISRWLSGKTQPSAENVIDFSRAAGDSPVAALVMFGYLKRSEAKAVVELEQSISTFEAGDLLAELGRRLGVRVTREGRRGA